ncbi:Capsule biosynthesis protein CapC [Rubripirellula amarantea]|uniref:Capsule biosynthesis protein CapC n=1 Tax=Rubripirellula amarantea TaxID=2527999 RepID=A0A5C5WVF2_9BACT|nr:poly-gamma-glutamate biosynthesis protein PgsC [Rubripirellula amarantea]TWT54924.1 Capsule biosynthesis protein CapC [Rubripirellula amarantea]
MNPTDMADQMMVAVGVGLVISLIFSELFGLAAGGMVVPGFIALNLGRPFDVLLTLFAAGITYLIVHALGTFIIIYGRRRTVLMILVGYLIRLLMDFIPFSELGSIEFLATGEANFMVIGYIIPGLIAIWMDRQGWLETMCALLTASVAIRMILVIIYGMALIK